VAKQLSQAEIDALLSSLRQAQQDAGARGAAAPGTPAQSGAAVGATLSAVLGALLGRAWQHQQPDLVVVAGPPAEAAPPTATRVIGLGAPLEQRLWLFWDEGGPAAPDAADALLAELDALLPGTWTHEALPEDTPFPADGVLLTFDVGGRPKSWRLTLGLERQGLGVLQEQLAGPAAPEAEPRPLLGVAVEDLEVEATVYVGGGIYRLSTLTALRPGSVLPLATEVGEPAVIAIQGRVIAYGEVMVTADETLAVRLTRVLLGEEGRLAQPAWLEQARREPGADRARAQRASPPSSGR